MIVKSSTFKSLTKKWGIMPVDRSASYKNSKCSRFNSKIFMLVHRRSKPFSQDWSNEANWLGPPIYLILITHFIFSESGTTRILILPSSWPSATFWLSLFEKQNRCKGTIQDTIHLSSTVFKQGYHDGLLSARKPLARWFFIFKSQITISTIHWWDIIKLRTFELHVNILLYYLSYRLYKKVFKVALSPSKKKCFIRFNESPLKMMKNTFV